MHKAIWDSSGYAPDVLKHFRLALYEIAGADRSVASFEKVLTGEGAKCGRKADVLRCTYKKIAVHGGGLMPVGHNHFDFEITAAPDQSSAARLRLCLTVYLVSPSVNPNPAPPPPGDSPWRRACN